MEILGRHGVEIDRCPACRGVWLDRQELDTIIERSGRFIELPAKEPRASAGNRRYAQDSIRDDAFEWF
jgi:Zn-finger nucleic acid-binding protein